MVIPAEPTSTTDFEVFAGSVKTRVEERLRAVADAHLTEVERLAPHAVPVAASLFDLALRGGKRIRPILLAVSHMACDGADDPAVAEAGAALEVLHAYLLIHDDWMDNDDLRRGAPSVPAALREKFGSRAVGDACAVLAGDLGQAIAFELLSRIAAPAPRIVSVLREASTMLASVVCGQVLDVRGTAESREEIDLMHRLKTSSYTTEGPFVIGALLAGADAGKTEALRAIGKALGLAFQLTDDLLGTFGDPTRTGKPVGSDLRRGKRSALVAELVADREAQHLLPRVLGVDDASDDEVEAVRRRMVASGAKARVEVRIEALARDARERVVRLQSSDEAKALLDGAVRALVGRKE